MALIETEPEPEFDIDALVSELQRDVAKAIDFLDSDFAGQREKAEEYYTGRCDIPVDGNRSRYVATKVRDTVRGVRPSLLRVFLSSVAPVEFLPSSSMPAALARQQTTYVAQLFEAAGGYMAIYSAFQNAMLHKVGPVQYEWVDETSEQFTTYSNLNAEQFDALQQQPDVRIVSVEQQMMSVIGPMGPTEEPVITAELAYSQKCGRIQITPVLLSEFIIDDGAINGLPPRVIGREVAMAISDILTTYPDVDPEQLADLADAEDVEIRRNSGESSARRGYVRRPRGKTPQDPSMRKVLITDVYWRADLDGTGIAQTWRWILGGTERELLAYERAEDGHNYALFQIDPKPGAVFGTSLYDLTKEDQDGLTSITRGVIDNAHASNNPRIAYHETMVNADDVLNFDIGSPIRFRTPGMIQVVDVPFTGGQLMPFVEYWNNDVENKTGVSRASLGLDPRALQSTDKEAVHNTIAAGAGQIEVMARNLAETGMIPLFRGILRLSMQHQDPKQVMWVTGTDYVAVDTRYYDPDLNIRVNVGLGGGDDEKRIIGLEKIMALQEKVVGAFGPANPVCQPHHMTQAMEDYVRALGFRDAARYITVLTPEQGAQLSQQAAEAAGAAPPPDPTVEGMKEAEMIKSQARMQEATMKSELLVREKLVDTELDMAKEARADDLERDRMLQDLYIAAGKLALEGGKLNVAGVQAQQRGEVERSRVMLDDAKAGQQAGLDRGRMLLDEAKAGGQFGVDLAKLAVAREAAAQRPGAQQ